jgi:hypothetical protein
LEGISRSSKEQLEHKTKTTEGTERFKSFLACVSLWPLW